MANRKVQDRESPVTDWLIEFVSARLADHTGWPQKTLIEKIKDGLASGDLATETWVVEWPGGTRSSQNVIPRRYFLTWWDCEGSYPIAWEEWGRLWPPDVFDDETGVQIQQLCGRWKSQTGSLSLIEFSGALQSAEAELCICRWETKKRSIRREDFVTWYEASSFRTSSALSLAVTADEIWPQHDRVESFAGLSLRDTIARACARLYPQGVPHRHRANVKQRDKLIGDYIVERGGARPSERTMRDAIKELAKQLRP